MRDHRAGRVRAADVARGPRCPRRRAELIQEGETPMDARIDRVEPRKRSGCNTWLVGDTDEVIVVDAGRDAEAVLAAVSGREILAVICTHGHPGHVAAALEVAARDEAPDRKSTRLN